MVCFGLLVSVHNLSVLTKAFKSVQETMAFVAVLLHCDCLYLNGKDVSRW